jgi:tetratricopeptide (TPR) repeat protein
MKKHRIRALLKKGKQQAALKLALELAAQHPNDGSLQLEVASIHDRLGDERAAIPFYLKALAAKLTKSELQEAFLGLGSTYRVLGRYKAALKIFDQGLAKFPQAIDLKVFRAMALYNVGRGKEAVQTLLNVLTETSNSRAVKTYCRAIEQYAKDLDWVTK